jgi:hypothetical protein
MPFLIIDRFSSRKAIRKIQVNLALQYCWLPRHCIYFAVGRAVIFRVIIAGCGI